VPHHVARRLILIGLMVALSALITAVNPVFMASGNLLKLLQEASQTGIVAVGFTFVMPAWICRSAG
jgi:ribose/xylose/arabinose/galactoside ABC-type transport system permease subunit